LHIASKHPESESSWELFFPKQRFTFLSERSDFEWIPAVVLLLVGGFRQGFEGKWGFLSKNSRLGGSTFGRELANPF
jgi:hypothetical protein